jgi:TRAP-type mannitol/chloroaromatic compound transport system permease small subunit
LTRFAHWIDIINEWTGKTIGPILIVMMLVGVYEVTSRNAFNKPTIWAWELDQYLLAVIVALGGAYTLLHRGHVSVDIVTARLSARTRAIIEMALFVSCFLPLMGILFWHSIDFAASSIALRETSTTTWRPIIYPFKACIPIAFLLMLLQGCSSFIRNLITVSHRRKAS